MCIFISRKEHDDSLYIYIYMSPRTAQHNSIPPTHGKRVLAECHRVTGEHVFVMCCLLSINIRAPDSSVVKKKKKKKFMNQPKVV
jgi:hypothetical protein